MDFPPLPMITRWSQIKDLKDEGGLTPAEEELLERTALGEVAEIGKVAPTIRSHAVTVRAPLLRYLILGGCADWQDLPAGVRLRGAWIDDVLDVSYGQANCSVVLSECHFPKEPHFRQAQFQAVDFDGSRFDAGLMCELITISGNLFLNGIKSQGSVLISGAKIGGQLGIRGARMTHAEGDAFSAEGICVGGGVFAEGLRTRGRVNFLGAEIAEGCAFHKVQVWVETGLALSLANVKFRADVRFDGARIQGQTSLIGANVAGQLVCRDTSFINPKRNALICEGMVVDRDFIWSGLREVSGHVSLISAKIGTLWDDAESWEKCETLSLDGMRYDRIHGSLHRGMRVGWLTNGALHEGEFKPQPFEHYADVMRETGHPAEARAVMIEKEKLQRATMRAGWKAQLKLRRAIRRLSVDFNKDRFDAINAIRQAHPEVRELNEKLRERFNLFHAPPQDENNAPATAAPHRVPDLTIQHAQQQFRGELRMANAWTYGKFGAGWCVDRVLRVTVAYGYRPERSAFLLLGLMAVAALLAHLAWEAGDFAPNAAPALMSDTWQALALDPAVENPAVVWGQATQAGRDYETFNALAYGADIVIPLIALGQEDAWAPSTTRGPWGWHLWWSRWVLTVLGWIVTAVGAAAVTGIIRKD